MTKHKGVLGGSKKPRSLWKP